MPLVRRGSPDAVPAQPAAGDAALAALSSDSSEERWNAARCLAGFAPAVDALARAARRETDARAREAIFTSLATINTAESVDAVLPCLRSDDANIRAAALDALKAMPAPVCARLQTLLDDPDPDVRVLACDLARVVPADQATSLLSAVLRREAEANVCGAAIDTLAEVGTTEALDALAACADRFPTDPFLGFAVKMARDRIGPKPRDQRE